MLTLLSATSRRPSAALTTGAGRGGGSEPLGAQVAVHEAGGDVARIRPLTGVRLGRALA
jgi:hypothetical protein